MFERADIVTVVQRPSTLVYSEVSRRNLLAVLHLLPHRVAYSERERQ